MCGPRGPARARPITCSATTGDGTFTDVTPGGRRRPTRKACTASASPGSTWTTTGGSTCSSPTTRARTTCTATSATARFEDVSYPSGRGARRQRPRAGAHGRRHRRLRQRRPRRHPHHELRRRLQRALPQRRRHELHDVSFRRAWRSCRSRSSAGARTSSTTTTTAGSICSSSTATSIRRPIASDGTRPTRSARCCSATWRASGSRRSARRPGRRSTAPRVSRGSAVGDFDNDGGVDIVVNNIDGAPTARAERRRRAAGHWLTMRLRGDPAQKCPRDAIGSVVFVTAGGVRVRGEVASGRGQISQSDLRVHFGLGQATTVDRARSPMGERAHGRIRRSRAWTPSSRSTSSAE